MDIQFNNKTHYEKYFKVYMEDPEFRKNWNEYKRIQMNNKYKNNEEYREDKKKKRCELYQRQKASRMQNNNTPISVN